MPSSLCSTGCDGAKAAAADEAVESGAAAADCEEAADLVHARPRPPARPVDFSASPLSSAAALLRFRVAVVFVAEAVVAAAAEVAEAAAAAMAAV